MNFVEKTVEVGKLFKALEIYENVKFKPQEEVFLNSSIKIKDEKNEWIDINAGITKNDTGVDITFDSGLTLSCAKKHKICVDGVNCKLVEELEVGDFVLDSLQREHYIIDIEDNTETLFYDLSVVSDTHLYQTANGLIHHNTEVSKQLASIMGMELIRFDMSEYMEKHSVSKFIGSPPGYVGYADGGSGSGLLINEVEKTPHCVLLLDEVEKAHPDVLNILLQIMDNGVLTSSSGKEVSFKNSIIIMTTNAGASDMERSPIGIGRIDRAGEDDKAINKFFAPEFRNRLDGVIKFKKLTSATMLKIVDKFIANLNKLAIDKNVSVELNAESREWLAKEGFDPKMGARPLSRVIDQNIKKPLSREMLFGSLKSGGTAKIVVVDNNLKITV